MVIFEKTPRTVIDLAFTRGNLPFDVETLERIEKQEEEFLKPKINNAVFLSFIPLAILAYLVLKK
mgnify:CR=1 FL=1|tara:strand:- start:374 stop:568 length:195 start_codon:yes stop_codon:yes gene_type:complete